MSMESPSRSSHPTLSTLPSELLIQIALHLDSASAVSFARVSKSCATSVETPLWRDLDFAIGPYDHDLLSSCKMEERELLGRAMERVSGIKLAERIKACMSRASQRRYEMVESIRLEPRPEAVVGMLQLLAITSTTLSSLQIVNNTDLVIRNLVRPHPIDTLDVQMLRSGITFPALTHIRLGEDAAHFAGLIYHLCDHAPNLISLDACVTQSLSSEWARDDSLPRFRSSFEADYPIRKLGLLVRELDRGDKDEDFEALQAFLHHCPKVDQLSLTFSGKTEDQSHGIVRAVDNEDTLRDFHCPSLWFALKDMSWEPGHCFSTLRRLIVRLSDEMEMFSARPDFTNLEALYIIPDPSPEPPVAVDRDSVVRQPTALLPPPFAAHLRSCPRLRTYHMLPNDINADGLGFFTRLDAIEASGDVGSVMSIRRGDCELLHARLLLNYREVCDLPHAGVYPTTDSSRLLMYAPAGAHGLTRFKIFERLETPVWTDFVDFEGMLIPVEVIEKVRIVEGVKRADWKGRGIQVGDRAWKLLRDWRDEIAPERAKARMEAEMKFCEILGVVPHAWDGISGWPGARVEGFSGTGKKKKKRKKKAAADGA